MNKAVLTVLVIMLVAGVFVEQGEAVLRAGRGLGTEKAQRGYELKTEAQDSTMITCQCAMPSCKHVKLLLNK